jgi:hypothetical protein
MMASSPTRRKLDPDRIHRRCVSQKVCHRTRAGALDAAEAQMDQGDVLPGCHLMPYECALCGYWHVHNQRIVFVL